jgi:hypothetical protein
LFEAGGVSKRASRSILIGLCGLGTAASCFVYFDEVRVEECNLHRYHTEIADYVSKNIGRAYIYAYGPTGTDQWELGYYISLFAYERLQELGREGLSQSELVAVVERKDLPVVLGAPRNIDGNVQLIASKDAAGEWDESASLRSRLARVNRAPRRHGDVFIWEWRVAADPRSSHRIAATEQTTGSPRELGSNRELGPSEGED